MEVIVVNLVIEHMKSTSLRNYYRDLLEMIFDYINGIHTSQRRNFAVTRPEVTNFDVTSSMSLVA